jgi:hypothetical protein
VPFTLHVTAIFELPVTVAVNCWVAPNPTEAVVGLTLTVMEGGGGDTFDPLLPHDRANSASATRLIRMHAHVMLVLFALFTRAAGSNSLRDFGINPLNLNSVER